MVKLKFCANISWLYKELPFMDRFEAAANSGFSGVEAGFPYEFSLSDLIKKKEDAHIEQVLINSGSFETRGSAGNDKDPQIFRDELELAIKYAKGLNCKNIHIMAGDIPQERNKNQAQIIFVENLKYASDQLMTHGITGLIEPLNSIYFPNYVFNTSNEAVDILKQVDRPNILYQLDFFHLQLMEGNLTKKIKDNFHSIGHIQISQVPNRNEPSAPGEIQYQYIFNLLEDLGYTKWIGCEYAPSGSSKDSLNWFENYLNS